MILGKYPQLQRFLSHVISLLVVLLLIVSTAAWTGKLFGYEMSKAAPEKVEQVKGVEMPSSEQLAALHLNSQVINLAPRDSASWSVVTNKDGKDLGVIISSVPYARDVEGYAGTTPIYIYVGTEGKVEALAPADNEETADFFEHAWDGLSEKWNGMRAEDAAKLQIDAVSGATYSSKAIIANVQAALAAYSASSHSQLAAPTIGWGKTAAVLVVLVIGFLVSMKFLRSLLSPKFLSYLRITVQLLNVIVLGFWCGQFLSVSLLRGWASNGFAPVAWLPTLCILLLAILMPFFGHRHYYCTWICPYGSLQDLAARLPLPKIRVSAKAARWMRRIRMTVLVVILLLLWANIGRMVLDYEPFTAFMVESAARDVMILAAVFVVASMFVPRLWCRAVCPMGQLLDLSEKDKTWF